MSKFKVGDRIIIKRNTVRETRDFYRPGDRGVVVEAGWELIVRFDDDSVHPGEWGIKEEDAVKLVRKKRKQARAGYKQPSIDDEFRNACLKAAMEDLQVALNELKQLFDAGKK